jgi:hypothetical protein
MKIEPIKRKSTKIPQCKKCQGYNHTQKYCGQEPRCVKCAGKHFTETCTMDRTNTAKCINCKGQHTANYRGCEVAVQLQKLRDQTRKHWQKDRAKDDKVTASNSVPIHAQTSNANRKTFSQVVKESGFNNDSETLGNIKTCVEVILKRLDEQSKLNKLIFDKIK